MDTFELEPGGAPDPPGRPPTPAPRLLLYALVAVVAIGIGSLVVSHATPAPAPHPVTTPAPRVSAFPAGSSPVRVRGTCPVRTDHRTVLTMSFFLENVSPVEASVTGVRAIRSFGDLRQAGVTRSGGSCRHPGTATGRAAIPPAQSLLYTVRWKLPESCPQPYPLQIRVTYADPQALRQRSDDTTLLVDLGTVGFHQCPPVYPVS